MKKPKASYSWRNVAAPTYAEKEQPVVSMLGCNVTDRARRTCPDLLRQDQVLSKEEYNIMKKNNFSSFHIRKWYLLVEEVLANESGALADGKPLRKFVIAACLHNPFAGRFVEDLSPFIGPSPDLGHEFARRLSEATQGLTIESYGKACLVGMDGEYEHGNALLTNPAANPVRESVGGGKAWVPSSSKRGGPGTSIDIPLAHKDALYVRSHYDTVTAQFSDAPNRDEVIVCWAVATRGRLHARLGGLDASKIKGQDGLY